MEKHRVKVIVKLNEEEINDILNGNICWYYMTEANENLGHDIDDELRKRIQHINDKFGELLG